MNFNRFAVPTLALFLGATCMVSAWARGGQQGPPPPAYGQGGYGQQRYGQDRDRGNWDMPPQELNDIQRQGFSDGIVGARKDFDNHRQPDVNNRDEYRNPHLPPEEREAYRDGFRRGYQRGVSHLMGAPGQQMSQPERPWDAPPDEFNEMQRRGFHDGLVGAQKDFDNHRRPDLNNRDEYRNPENIPHGMRETYREGFERGYDAGARHLWGDSYEQ